VLVPDDLYLKLTDPRILSFRRSSYLYPWSQISLLKSVTSSDLTVLFPNKLCAQNVGASGDGLWRCLSQPTCIQQISLDASSSLSQVLPALSSVLQLPTTMETPAVPSVLWAQRSSATNKQKVRSLDFMYD